MGEFLFKAESSATVIDNVFIDEYMCSAVTPVFSLIYIYSLRCIMSGKKITNEDIAKKFNILESEVIKAWKYWEAEGLVVISENSGKTEISFVKPAVRVKNDKPELVEIAAAKEIKKVEPVYKPSDVSKLMDESSVMKSIIMGAESILGKTLNVNDVTLIAKMYDWYGMSESIIMMLLNYCIGKGNKNMGYIEKVAMDWYEKGITTLEQAEEYLDIISNDYVKIIDFCGMKNRKPTKSQQDYMYKWLYTYKMPLPVIEQACTRAIDTTGNAGFKYINSIVENWHKKGVRTVKDIEAVDAEFKRNMQQAQEKKSAKPQRTVTPKPNKFINYEQPIYSQEQWQEIMERKARKNEL